MGSLADQPLVSVADMCATGGIRRQTLHRVLATYGVKVVLRRRTALVPWPEIERRIPLLWRSLLAIEHFARPMTILRPSAVNPDKKPRPEPIK
jgi:hypothetical protein